jgi:hypothetical protein
MNVGKNQYQLLNENTSKQSEINSVDIEDGLDTPRLSVQNYRNNFAEDMVHFCF